MVDEAPAVRRPTPPTTFANKLQEPEPVKVTVSQGSNAVSPRAQISVTNSNSEPEWVNKKLKPIEEAKPAPIKVEVNLQVKPKPAEPKPEPIEAAPSTSTRYVPSEHTSKAPRDQGDADAIITRGPDSTLVFSVRLYHVPFP